MLYFSTIYFHFKKVIGVNVRIFIKILMYLLLTRNILKYLNNKTIINNTIYERLEKLTIFLKYDKINS